MQVGIHFVNFTLPGVPESIAPALSETATVADQGGVAGFTLMDHWFQMEGFPDRPRPDARGLHRARLRSRPDELDDARLARDRRDLPPPGPAGEDRDDTRRAVGRSGRARHRCGVVRARALGPRRPVSRRYRERFERLEETLQICLQMWSDDDGPFKGRHYELAETICSPPPIAATASAHSHRRRR